MADGAYSQETAFLDNWFQWLSPGAEDSQGTAGDPGAPRPLSSPFPDSPASPDVPLVKADRLCLLQPDAWDQEKDYGADPPTCIRYTIVWKVKVNNRMVATDTEQDIVLAPAHYWSMSLKPKLDALVSKKTTSRKRISSDDTNLVVSVNERTERDLIRRFDELKVDWSVVEKQLLNWGEFLRVGKRLRVDISFNYVETQAVPAANGPRAD